MKKEFKHSALSWDKYDIELTLQANGMSTPDIKAISDEDKTALLDLFFTHNEDEIVSFINESLRFWLDKNVNILNEPF